MKRTIVSILISVALLAACQSAKIATGGLQVRNAWARPASAGGNGAVYFVIENGTEQAEVLLSAGADIATAVELHRSQMEGDHMSMHPQEEIALPAGEAVEFSPGGLHVMLIGLTRDLKAGDTFDLVLTFEVAGEQMVTVTVRDDVNDD
jgi:copper(I)-binding protein